MYFSQSDRTSRCPQGGWQVGAEAGGVSPYARKLRKTIRHLKIPRDTSGHWLRGWISLISLIPALSFGFFQCFLRFFFLGSPGVRGAKAELTETTKRSPAVQDDVDMEFGRSVDRTGLWDLQMSCGRFQVAWSHRDDMRWMMMMIICWLVVSNLNFIFHTNMG